MEFSTSTDERDRAAAIAYDAFAPVYDEFTHANDYETWFSLLLPELERHGLRRGRLLDVGCGSGKSFGPMLRRGWRVHGCDVSAAMVARAREKAGAEVRLDVADMRELPVYGEHELVWALNDAVNYLFDAEEMRAALVAMRANLAPGGLLLFDLNTISSFRGFFSEEVVVERDGVRMLWRGGGSSEAPPGTLVESTFAVERTDGGIEIEPQVHRERHFPVAETLATIERAGLECLDVIGLGADELLHRPLDEDEHYKAIYIARAAA